VPVYEYRCESGHHYDKTEGFDAPREHECLTCGAKAVRQISLPAVIFKGPGFYSTDNRGSSRGGNGKSADPDTSLTSSSSDNHGHSHSDGGHSHGSDSGSKTEVAAE
jgi:putative FmdB family regulatory protein